jgi:hypothetical protein
MRKALLSIAAAAALLSATAIQPARADGGATAIIIGAVAVSTVVCERRPSVLCVLSPVEWVRVVTGRRRGRVFVNGR